MNNIEDEEQENFFYFPTNIVRHSEKPKSRLGRRKKREEAVTHPFTPARSASEKKQPEALRDIANILQEPNPLLNDSFVSDSSTSTSVSASAFSESFKTPGRSFYYPSVQDSPLDPLQGVFESPRCSSTLYFSPASTVKKSNAHKTLFGKSNEAADRSFGITRLDDKKPVECRNKDFQTPNKQDGVYSTHPSSYSALGRPLTTHLPHESWSNHLEPKHDSELFKSKRVIEVDCVDAIMKQDSLSCERNPLRKTAPAVERDSLTDSASSLRDPSLSNSRMCQTQDYIKTPFSSFLSKDEEVSIPKPIPGIEQITKNFSAQFSKFASPDVQDKPKLFQLPKDSPSKPALSIPNIFFDDNKVDKVSASKIHADSSNFNFKKSSKETPHEGSLFSKPFCSNDADSNSGRFPLSDFPRINKINTIKQEDHVKDSLHHYHSAPYISNSANMLSSDVNNHMPGILSSYSKSHCSINSDSGVLTADSLPSGDLAGFQNKEKKPSEVDHVSLSSLSLSSSSSNSQPTLIPSHKNDKGINSLFQASVLKNDLSVMEGHDVINHGLSRSNIFHSSILKSHHDKEEKHNSFPFSSKEHAFKRPSPIQNNNCDSILKFDLKNSDNLLFPSVDRQIKPNLKESESREEHPVKKVASSERHPDAMFKKPASVTSRHGKHHPNLPEKISVNGVKYPVLSLLGKGGSSEVYQGLGGGNEFVAIKCVNLESVDKAVADGYLNEIKQLENLQMSPSVIKMFNYEYKEQSKKLLVVMEKGDTDFANLIKSITKTKRISIPMIIYYWTEMLTCVHDIHQSGVIHSDLKPANFLLVGGRLKLIDFGIASSIQEDMTSVIKDVTTGTFNYMSPEAIINNSETQRGHKISFKSDVWSLGCILYQLLYGKTPYSHLQNIWTKMQAIADMKCVPFYPNDIDVPYGLKIALRWCLVKDPKRRPTTSQLLKIPYYLSTQTSSRGAQFESLLFAEIMEMFPDCPVDMK